jgi:hypothetical protein
MPNDLVTTTYAHAYVLADYASIAWFAANPGVLPDGDPRETHDGRSLIVDRAGRGVFYFPPGGEGCKATVYVDEDPPATLLLAPAGSDAGVIRTSDDIFLEAFPQHREARDRGRLELPSGEYRVEAAIVDAPFEARSEATFDHVQRAGCIVTAALLFAGIVLVGVGEWGLAGALAGVIGVYWAANLSWFVFSGRAARERLDHERVLHEGPPDFIVVLRRIDAGREGGGS